MTRIFITAEALSVTLFLVGAVNDWRGFLWVGLALSMTFPIAFHFIKHLVIGKHGTVWRGLGYSNCFTHWRPFKYTPREPVAPKKKVVKYRWVLGRDENVLMISACHHTEEEARGQGWNFVQRIDASAKEFEE